MDTRGVDSLCDDSSITQCMPAASEWLSKKSYLANKNAIMIKSDFPKYESPIIKRKNESLKESGYHKSTHIGHDQDENQILNISKTSAVTRQKVDEQIRKVVSDVTSPKFVEYLDGSLDRVMKKEKERAKRNPRCKFSRRLMNGYECPCCKDYYDAMELEPEERRRYVNRVSKHRAFEPIPTTPPRYWDLDIPDADEQVRLGYVINSTSPLVKTSAQKRKLASISKKRKIF